MFWVSPVICSVGFHDRPDFKAMHSHRLSPLKCSFTRLRHYHSELLLPTKMLVEGFHNGQLITASVSKSAARQREIVCGFR